MGQSSLLLVLTGTVPGLVLVYAGTRHLQDLPRLRALLIVHGVVTLRWVAPLSVLSPLAQLLTGSVGFIGVTSVVVGSRSAWILLVPQLVVLVGLSTYLVLLSVTGRGTDCGCFGIRAGAFRLPQLVTNLSLILLSAASVTAAL